MDLILWRHADAAEDGDSDRALTTKGERQARRIARWLDHHLPDGARVFVGPSQRAQQTALALGRKYKVRDELAPGATVDDVLALLRWDDSEGPHGKSPTVIVGHQPWLGQLASRLLGMDPQACVIRKGAAWWLRARAREGSVQTVLLAANCPDLAGDG
jgi:phosphohistidine phosphatase